MIHVARRRLGWAVGASLFAAFALSIFPLPAAFEPYRPDWVAMTVIFWIISLPGWVGIGAAWLAGILLDTLQGSLLGQHAVALTVPAYIAFRLHRRIRVFPIWQETFAVFLLLIIYHLILLWIDGATGRPVSLEYLTPILTSAAIWPLWVSVLNAVVRQTR